MKKNTTYLIIGIIIFIVIYGGFKSWFIKELIPGEDCYETDESLDKFNVGITNNVTHEEEDYCQPDLGRFLYEFACSENKITLVRYDCTLSNAFCYQGKCIFKNRDFDGDGLTDYEELTPGGDGKVTDYLDPESK